MPIEFDDSVLRLGGQTPSPEIARFLCRVIAPCAGEVAAIFVSENAELGDLIQLLHWQELRHGLPALQKVNIRRAQPQEVPLPLFRFLSRPLSSIIFHNVRLPWDSQEFHNLSKLVLTQSQHRQIDALRPTIPQLVTILHKCPRLVTLKMCFTLPRCPGPLPMVVYGPTRIDHMCELVIEHDVAGDVAYLLSHITLHPECQLDFKLFKTTSELTGQEFSLAISTTPSDIPPLRDIKYVGLTSFVNDENFIHRDSNGHDWKCLYGIVGGEDGNPETNLKLLKFHIYSPIEDVPLLAMGNGGLGAEFFRSLSTLACQSPDVEMLYIAFNLEPLRIIERLNTLFMFKRLKSIEFVAENPGCLAKNLRLEEWLNHVEQGVMLCPELAELHFSGYPDLGQLFAQQLHDAILTPRALAGHPLSMVSLIKSPEHSVADSDAISRDLTDIQCEVAFTHRQKEELSWFKS